LNETVPRISIITPSFNQGRYLEEMIDSVAAQQWPDLEFIIIDGGSTDGTVEIIRNHEHRFTWWVSEPDRGQADALNKGLRRATGDIVTMFNTDDVYADGIFVAVADAWRRNRRAIYAAPVSNFYSRGREMLIRPHGLTLENVVQYWKRQSVWHDPGVFWSRAVIDTIGELDESLTYTFDFDYLARALQHFPVEYVDHVAAGFRLHQESKTISQIELMMAETSAVSQRYWHLLPSVDREGFDRAQFDAAVRRALSKLIRGRRDALPLLWRVLRDRPLRALLQLALLFPRVFAERFRRLLPARYF
jgi:glycosyltransferase involved in cell wall biosynthesis